MIINLDIGLMSISAVSNFLTLSGRYDVLTVVDNEIYLSTYVAGGGSADVLVYSGEGFLNRTLHILDGSVTGLGTDGVDLFADLGWNFGDINKMNKITGEIVSVDSFIPNAGYIMYNFALDRVNDIAVYFGGSGGSVVVSRLSTNTLIRDYSFGDIYNAFICTSIYNNRVLVLKRLSGYGVDGGSLYISEDYTVVNPDSLTFTKIYDFPQQLDGRTLVDPISMGVSTNGFLYLSYGTYQSIIIKLDLRTIVL